MWSRSATTTGPHRAFWSSIPRYPVIHPENTEETCPNLRCGGLESIPVVRNRLRLVSGLISDSELRPRVGVQSGEVDEQGDCSGQLQELV